MAGATLFQEIDVVATCINNSIPIDVPSLRSIVAFNPPKICERCEKMAFTSTKSNSPTKICVQRGSVYILNPFVHIQISSW